MLCFEQMLLIFKPACDGLEMCTCVIIEVWSCRTYATLLASNLQCVSESLVDLSGLWILPCLNGLGLLWAWLPQVQPIMIVFEQQPAYLPTCNRNFAVRQTLFSLTGRHGKMEMLVIYYCCAPKTAQSSAELGSGCRVRALCIQLVQVKRK